jgi:glycosyltransferase involved in cell wall biosynthesis
MKLEALAECNRDVTLRVIGYEVPGNIGYTDKLKAEAERLGVGSRFEYLGTLPQRSDLMARAAECDVGLSLLQYRSSDINMRHMVGASNKPFDYLSQGLALIVPSEQEWQRLYVNNGCAITCEPGSKDELIQVFQWLADHREKVLEMGKRGQQLVASSWNYEAQFEPLLQLMDRQ